MPHVVLQTRSKGKDTARFHITGLQAELQVQSAEKGMPSKFISTLLKELEASNGEIVLFIHGFNVDWSEAIKGAAQLTWDTSPASDQAKPEPSGKRVALAFDWASLGSIATYGYLMTDDDRKRVLEAKKHLPTLLRTLVKVVRYLFYHTVLHTHPS